MSALHLVELGRGNGMGMKRLHTWSYVSLKCLPCMRIPPVYPGPIEGMEMLQHNVSEDLRGLPKVVYQWPCMWAVRRRETDRNNRNQERANRGRIESVLEMQSRGRDTGRKCRVGGYGRRAKRKNLRLIHVYENKGRIDGGAG